MIRSVKLTIGYAIAAGVVCARLLGCVPWGMADANETAGVAAQLAACQAQARKAADQCVASDAGVAGSETCDRAAMLKYYDCRKENGL
jgi:hypothetical protein